MWKSELISAGVPGLVGITGIIGTFLAPVRAQRMAARRQERRDFRTASRLVLDELETVEMHFLLLVENRRVPTRRLDDVFLPTAMWMQYKHVLAEALADDDWEGAPTVMGTIDHHRLLLSENEPGSVIDGAMVARAAEAAELVAELRSRLRHARPVND